MGEKKKQHFVPRFHLKNFSFDNDGRSVGVWIIDKGCYVQRASLRNQACGDHFYGQNTVIEDALGLLEGGAASVIARMIDTRTVPREGCTEHLCLLAFVVSLSLRTRYQADAVNEAADKFFKMAYKDDPRIGSHLDQFTIWTKDASALALRSLDRALIASMDLGCKLLVSDTPYRFLTSDNPVVKHNQFMKDRDPTGSHLGFLSKGFQMLLSINPATCLVLYDRDSYRIGNRRESAVAISGSSDVDEINRLQYINADDTLYFNHEISQDYIRRIASEAKRFRPKSKVVLHEYADLNPEPGVSRSIIHGHPYVVQKDLNLSCVHTLKKAKKYDIGDKLTHYRDPGLAQYLLAQSRDNVRADEHTPE